MKTELAKSDPVMIFKVYADNHEVSSLECPYGAVTMIPFRANISALSISGPR